MIITKQQQAAWVQHYINDKHSQDECSGFIDGVEKVVKEIHSNADIILASIAYAALPQIKSDILAQIQSYTDRLGVLKSNLSKAYNCFSDAEIAAYEEQIRYTAEFIHTLKYISERVEV
jgi:hypothetical protein